MTPIRLSQLREVLGKNGIEATLEGDDRIVSAVNTLEAAAGGELSFLSNVKYLSALETTRADAVIVPNGVQVPARLTAMRCRDPYGAVTAAIVAIHGYRKHPQWGRSLSAQIDPTARIGSAPNLANGVTISAAAVVGNNCTMYPGCYIGEGARIGDDCVLFPNVVIYDGCVLGNRVTVHAGSVIGEDGLGFAPQNGHWVKIPQIGRVVVGDDVEIGANCTIDRATLGQTEIGSGTKFGNVVVIGHGTKIGPDCLFVGLVGLAGSVTVGRNVTLAGQVGVAGHLTIGDEARVGAQAGVNSDVDPKASMLGSPALPLDDARRSVVLVGKLPEMAKRLRSLEQEVRQLRAQLNGQVASGERAPT